MSKIWLKWFGGMVPRQGEQHLNPKRLEETGLFRRPPVNPNVEIERGVHATEAENCNLYSGELRPLHKPALAHHFCQPGDECWHVPIPDDPSVPPPEPPPPPPNCVPVVITGQPGPPVCKYYACDAFDSALSGIVTASAGNAWTMEEQVNPYPSLTGGLGLSWFGTPTNTAVNWMDTCNPSTGPAVAATEGARITSAPFVTTINGTIGTWADPVVIGSWRTIQVTYTTSATFVSLSMNGNIPQFQLAAHQGDSIVAPFPTPGSNDGSYYIMRWSIDPVTGAYSADIFINFVYGGTVSGSINAQSPIDIPNPAILVGATAGTGATIVQRVFYLPSEITDAEVSTLKDAQDQNISTYTDPDPECRDPL